MPRRGQQSLSHLTNVADSSPNNVTNMRDVIDVPVSVVDVGDSSLRVPSLLSDEPTVELSGLLSTKLSDDFSSTCCITYAWECICCWRKFDTSC